MSWEDTIKQTTSTDMNEGKDILDELRNQVIDAIFALRKRGQGSEYSKTVLRGHDLFLEKIQGMISERIGD
tara:strand:- start:13 stop:225 length:213 start_codon:yes stop_codon:yes gene_type:complete